MGGLDTAITLAWDDVDFSFSMQDVDEVAHRSVSRFAMLSPMPLLVSSCVGESEDEGRLVGLSNIESLHCLFPKPGLLSAGLVMEAGSLPASFGLLRVVTQDMDEDAHR